MTNLDTRIEKSIRRNPDAKDGRIAKNLGTVAAEVRRVRNMLLNSIPVDPCATLSPSGGIRLQGMTVALRKPADSAASFIRRLPKDQGFLPDALARQWGIAENTIKRHAKDLNCLRFVEVAEGEWSAMVMHPETATKYSI